MSPVLHERARSCQPTTQGAPSFGCTSHTEPAGFAPARQSMAPGRALYFGLVHNHSGLDRDSWVGVEDADF